MILRVSVTPFYPQAHKNLSIACVRCQRLHLINVDVMNKICVEMQVSTTATGKSNGPNERRDRNKEANKQPQIFLPYFRI